MNHIPARCLISGNRTRYVRGWLAVLALAGIHVHAATRTWDAGAGNTWDTGTTASWTGAVWNDNDDAIFGATGAGTVNIIGAGVLANSVTINNGGYTFAGGGIGGSGGLTANLTGGAVVYMDTPNSFTGATVLSGGNGYLVIRNATGLGTSAGGVTVANGNTLQLEHGTGITVSGEAATVSGLGVGGTRGAIGNWSGNNTWTGPVTLAGDSGFFAQAGTLTFSGAIGESGGSRALTKQGAGSVVLSGTGANTFTGLTTVNQGNLYLNKTGVVALGGNVQLGAGNTNQPNLRMQQSNQFASGATLSFGNASGNWGRFDLAATTQTLAGLSAGALGTLGGAVTQNVGTDGVGAGAGTLVLNGSGSYVYNGYFRDQDNGGTTNKLNLNKTGTGTQTLAGNQVNHTGTTSVAAGELVLYNAVNYRSPTSVAGGATLSWGGSADMQNSQSGATISLASGATLQNTNPSNWSVINGAVTAAGTTTINQTSGATGAAGRGFFLDGGLHGSGTVTINATNAGSGVNFRNNNSTFSGTLVVNGIASATAFAGSGISVGGATTGLQNANITLNGTMELLNQGMGWANTASGQFRMGGLNGTGVMVGNFTSGGVTTVTLGNNGAGGTFTGTIANGTGNTVNIVKEGAGAQVLGSANVAGSGITYTGSTAVNGGSLTLVDARLNGNAKSVAGGATLEINSSIPFGTRWNNGGTLSGAGTFVKSGTGVFGTTGTVSLTGQINIIGGRIHNDNVTGNWTGSTADVDVGAAGVLDLRANDIYVDSLNGSGEIWNSHSAGGNSDTLFIGVANGSGSFTGQLRGSDTQADDNPNAAFVNVTKNGTGTQVLTGSGITYAGATTVNAGTLRFTDTSVLNTSIANASSVELNAATAGDSWRLLGGRTLSGAGTWIKTGPGRATFDNTTVNLSGVIQIQEGTLRNNFNSSNWSASTADIDISAGAILDLYADPVYVDQLTGSGIVQNNYGNPSGQSGSSAFLEKLFVGVANGSSIFGGTIRDNATNASLTTGDGRGGLELTKQGSGTLTLTAANTFSGETRVLGGTLAVTHADALSRSGYVHDNLGGTLDIGTLTTLNLGGLRGAQNLALQNNSAQALALTVGNHGFADTYTGQLSGPGTLTKVGVGTQTLGGTAPNTYAGTTVIQNAGANVFAPLILAKTAGVNAVPGALQIGNSGSGFAVAQLGASNQIPDGNPLAFVGTVNNWAYLKMMGNSETVAGISSAANGVIENTEAEAGITTDSTLTLNMSGTQSFTGYMRDRAGGSSTGRLLLTKQGSGTQTLVGGNVTYTGDTSIQGGGLVLNNTTGFNSNLQVNPGTSLIMDNSTGGWGYAKAITGTGTFTMNGSGVINQGHYDFRNANLSGFTGTFTMANNARIYVNDTNDLPGSAVNITAGNQILATTGTISKPITIAGTGWNENAGQIGALRLEGGANWSGPITMSADARIGAWNGSVVTVSGAIGGSGNLELWNRTDQGYSSITLSGTANNTFSGDLVVATRAYPIFAKTGGAIAVPGNVQFGDGSASVQPYIRMTENNQFGPASVVHFNNLDNGWSRFELQGTTQTLAGIVSTAGRRGGVIQNSESGVGGGGVLNVNNNVDNLYAGWFRDGSAGTLSLNKGGLGTLTLSGDRVYHTGPTTISAGTLRLLDATAFNSNIQNNSSLLLERSIGGGWAYPRAIAGNGSMEARMTNGGWLYLDGASTFTAPVALTGNNGYLVLRNNTALGAAGGGVTVANGNSLQLEANPGNITIAGESATITGLGVGGQRGAIASWTGDNTWSGPVTMTGDSGAYVNFGSLTISGVLGESGGSHALVKQGPGTLNLANAANTYTGKTVVRQGTLALTGGPGALGATAPAADALTLGGTVGGNSSGTLRITGGSLNLGAGRGITLLGTGGTLDVDTGLTLSASAGITGDTSVSVLTKAGAGTFNLTGDASLNALIVSGGTYRQLSGDTLIITTSTGLDIRAGATYELVGGTLRVDKVTVASGGGFKWGAGRLSHAASIGSQGTVDYSVGSYHLVRSGTTTQFEGDLTTENGSILSFRNSPTLYLNNGTRFNNYAVVGDLDLLAANDTLEFELNPLLLRPFSGAGQFSTEMGSLPLLTWTGAYLGGNFDNITGVFSQGAGFAMGGPVSDPNNLALNTWYIELDIADQTLWFHYKVSGYVPEPSGFSLLAVSAYALRLLRGWHRRRADAA